MEMWEIALHKFINEWKNRSNVTAALVCGSYVTGNPSKRSDIDVHIILSDDVGWRERGNKIIDHFLIEYFANPTKQIRKYFQDDYRDRRTMSMVQFITGKVLFDKSGAIQKLKIEAQEWMNKKYENTNQVLLEVKKYEIWDTWDNLQNCYEQQSPDFHLVYYNSLSNLFVQYCTYLGVELIPHYQIHSYLTDPKYKKKYLKETFPDTIFSTMFIEAIEKNAKIEMINSYKQIVQYITNKMGGFEIDGWKINSPIDI
ncbi:nucleotidyltransferase domain-containing protein [Metabacillus bambusae]|uniref:Nucleotidyltransferase domain-containing protein n=1 Tax=Metabacillus bambusae TaxID=2795218 RepID=A0ABS3MW77_9BACI|nr:nucleotidyltransferase domain-containing protein [Metabacillus bambusae]MBO1510086.1 nucleotidyltransferase domain-containing protein [Metabacillus bambusae]